VLVGAQHAPQVLGQERHHRRDHLHRADEREPELLKRGLVVASPKPSARAADVPVRKVVDEGHEGAGDVRRPEAVVGIRHVGNKLIGAGPQPAIERVRGVGLGGIGPELLDIRVVDEELDRVPQRQQSPFDLACRRVAELHPLGRRLLAVHPAHDVRAHPRQGLLSLDRVPPRAVHLVTVLVAHVLVSQHLAKRRTPVEHDRHEQQ
jgi:hypothetical protein